MLIHMDLQPGQLADLITLYTHAHTPVCLHVTFST